MATSPDPADEAYSCSACGINATVEQQKNEALRQLLSYCKTNDGRYLKTYEAYRDVANKLAAILDGES